VNRYLEKAAGLEKAALNAMKRRAMAKTVGLIPDNIASPWKAALRQLRDCRGNALGGRALQEDRIRLGDVHPSTIQQILSKVKKGRPGDELLGQLSPEGRVISLSHAGYGGGSALPDSLKRTVHSHPSVTSTIMQNSIGDADHIKEMLKGRVNDKAGHSARDVSELNTRFGIHGSFANQIPHRQAAPSAFSGLEMSGTSESRHAIKQIDDLAHLRPVMSEMQEMHRKGLDLTKHPKYKEISDLGPAVQSAFEKAKMIPGDIGAIATKGSGAQSNTVSENGYASSIKIGKKGPSILYFDHTKSVP